MNNITSVINDVRQSVIVDSNKVVDDADKYIKEYGPYPYYVGLAACCLLLLIAICIILGLICGICGKRPDAYSDDCCNKGAGSRFLMWLVIFFLNLLYIKKFKIAILNVFNLIKLYLTKNLIYFHKY